MKKKQIIKIVNIIFFDKIELKNGNLRRLRSKYAKR